MPEMGEVEKMGPSFARIGKLEHAPPRQSCQTLAWFGRYNAV